MAPSYRRNGAPDRDLNPGERLSSERGTSGGSRSPRQGEPQPLWLAWLQLGVSTMLVVLFLVVLGKVREQATTIGELEQKVRAIENARSQDRTKAMEQQLESMIQRLQSVEQVGDQLRKVDRQQQAITQDLQQLRNSPHLGLDDLPSPSSPGLAAQGQGRPSALPGSPRPSTTPLRPPADNP